MYERGFVDRVVPTVNSKFLSVKATSGSSFSFITIVALYFFLLYFIEY